MSGWEWLWPVGAYLGVAWTVYRDVRTWGRVDWAALVLSALWPVCFVAGLALALAERWRDRKEREEGGKP